jgi:hypothetical protein
LTDNSCPDYCPVDRRLGHALRHRGHGPGSFRQRRHRLSGHLELLFHGPRPGRGAARRLHVHHRRRRGQRRAQLSGSITLVTAGTQTVTRHRKGKRHDRQCDRHGGPRPLSPAQAGSPVRGAQAWAASGKDVQRAKEPGMSSIPCSGDKDGRRASCGSGGSTPRGVQCTGERKESRHNSCPAREPRNTLVSGKESRTASGRAGLPSFITRLPRGTVGPWTIAGFDVRWEPWTRCIATASVSVRDAGPTSPCTSSVRFAWRAFLSAGRRHRPAGTAKNSWPTLTRSKKGKRIATGLQPATVAFRANASP